MFEKAYGSQMRSQYKSVSLSANFSQIVFFPFAPKMIQNTKVFRFMQILAELYAFFHLPPKFENQSSSLEATCLALFSYYWPAQSRLW